MYQDFSVSLQQKIQDMDILIMFLTVMAVVYFVCGTGAGIMDVLGKCGDADEHLKDLPIKGFKRNGKVRISVAYKNLRNGTFNAKISSPYSGDWARVITKDEEEFKKRVRKAMDDMEASSIEYLKKENRII